MKKALKIIGKILLGLLILLTVFLIIMTVYNQIMLKKNKDLYEKPLGQLVEVDGHNMSIYTEGEGQHTIVFMSGWGTSSPILDFKPLYSRLSDEYRCVVVEKFGYGFSDIVDGERDMDTLLRQDREALQKAGIEAPYVLCAHSFSGYEATLWAQKYPDEVEGIVGLDMCTPNCESEETQKNESKQLGLVKLINRAGKNTGLIRLVDYDQSGTLTEDEEKIFTEIACHITANDTIINEGDIDCRINATAELNSAPLPTVPVLMYVSADNSGDELWVGGMQAMVDASLDGKLIQLDCGHYVHDFEYERISGEMKAFIAKL
ncbi:Pimeloyl-ACP methyl ester carboxylesterase [Ruminococcus sp. YE71]|uniref:alpha/beta fold hydrolase n=1 Tax=unclassified Ruminococcus TaxID=2608920 RepID=UPI00088C743B|nr:MULTISPECIES: alpha/beta hydrolase [unclassified Ruminococcus]SDA15868.1 Pimeloyl-ACP methyl ester carboxylesterase [Ruminococcus sp. YE78]SFW23350.1 Pimeloyl-ACP methyl ester carboxylesterase [Ruminococcus sp. YE71]